METIANEAVRAAGTTKGRTGRFGKLGLDVGVFGRWSRLLWGVAMLLPLSFGAVRDLQSSGSSLILYGLAGAYFLGIGASYVSIYWVFGDRVFARANPWVNTFVFVGPALVVAGWEFSFGPLIGFDLPSALPLGMLVYIGTSFILMWKLRYGGWQVVALPILLSKRRYTTYCLPLVTLDAVEKVVVERILPAEDAG